MKEGESNENTVKFLNNFIEQKKNEFESYLPEQAKVVEKGEVVTKGNYIVLLISSQKDALEAQLPKALQ